MEPAGSQLSKEIGEKIQIIFVRLVCAVYEIYVGR